MTHSELCRLTAIWALTPPRAAWLALYEYQSYASQEFPDVFAYGANGTILYEIKISRSDFLADLKKPARACRADYRVYSGVSNDLERLRVRSHKYVREGELDPHAREIMLRKASRLEAFFHCVRQHDRSFQQAPHLGGHRYYVCEPGIIEKDDLPQGWGLLHYHAEARAKGKRFVVVAKSEAWKADVRIERDLAAHALRRFASGDRTGILVRAYSAQEEKQEAEA